MIFEISCWIFLKIINLFNFHLVKIVIFGYFSFRQKNTLELQKLFKKRPKSSNCLTILHISSKKNYVDLFSRTIDMESPFSQTSKLVTYIIYISQYAMVTQLVIVVKYEGYW